MEQEEPPVELPLPLQDDRIDPKPSAPHGRHHDTPQLVSDLSQSTFRRMTAQLLDQQVPTLPFLDSTARVRDDHDSDLRLSEERRYEPSRIRRVPVEPSYDILGALQPFLGPPGRVAPGLVRPSSDHAQEVVAGFDHPSDVLLRDNPPVDDQGDLPEAEPSEHLEGRCHRHRIAQ